MGKRFSAGQSVCMPDRVWQKWKDNMLIPKRTGMIVGYFGDEFVRVVLDSYTYETIWHEQCWELD